jgi:hypothetical protein
MKSAITTRATSSKTGMVNLLEVASDFLRRFCPRGSPRNLVV